MGKQLQDLWAKGEGERERERKGGREGGAEGKRAGRPADSLPGSCL